MVQTNNRILFLDIETAPHIGYTWGKYEQNVIKFLSEGHLLCFAYKWQGEDTRVVSLPDFNRYKRDRRDDGGLARELHKLLNEANIVITHNGDKFDLKKSNTYFIKHKLPPPSPYRTVDTLKVARKYFSFSSNKLDDLGEYLGVGRKLHTGGFELWEKCLEGDREAWKTMCEYNKQDVDLLEQVYLRLLPYMQNHPNLLAINACPACAGKVHKRGSVATITGHKQRYQCQDCGKWSLGLITKPEQILR